MSGTALTSRPDNPSLVSWTCVGKKRTHTHKLSSDHPKCATVYMWTDREGGKKRDFSIAMILCR